MAVLDAPTDCAKARRQAMSDRELLGLAAKAAGIPIKGWDITDAAFYWFDRPGGCLWNPLTDDGDALRLMVQCKIDVKHYDAHVVAWWDTYFGTGKIAHNGDPYAATRRAITTAAAELGKQTGSEP
jgi:hypothetical protein